MENGQEVAGGRRQQWGEGGAGEDYARRLAAGRGTAIESELELSKERIAQ
jgi:hypothetical protein